MENFQNFVNLNINSILPEPKPIKHLSYPLETIDEDLARIYCSIDTLLTKVKIAQKNPTNESPAYTKLLKNVEYKVASCRDLIKQINQQIQKI